jgi:hypothetical protein
MFAIKNPVPDIIAYVKYTKENIKEPNLKNLQYLFMSSIITDNASLVYLNIVSPFIK